MNLLTRKRRALMKELQQLNSDLAALEGGHQDGDLASACLHNMSWTRMTNLAQEVQTQLRHSVC
jgi:hypothetical protein